MNNSSARIQKSSSHIGADDFVQIVDVSKKFGEATAVKNVNLSIRKNEMFALLGSSGCGKSTLLRMMAGLETPTSGRILIDGEDLAKLPPYRRPVNMMFQSYALFPHMTVEKNVGYGLVMEGCRKDEIRARVADVLELVQMSKYLQRKPHQLSGGQQQRVALARSLIKRPKLLLLDEPMSALDKKIRQQTQFELGSILYKVGVTCVMVTHDQEEAMTMADRIAVMNDGAIVQTGSPNDVYEFPNCRFTAEFIGSTNLFHGTIAADDHQLMRCPDLPAPLALQNPVTGPENREYTVSIRPEQVLLSREPLMQRENCSSGVVEQYAYMGSYSLYFIRLASGKQMLVSASQLLLRDMDRAPDYGETVHLSWQPSSVVVLAR